jgi:cyclopropane-fatty-acyl-phospholipid synthase
MRITHLEELTDHYVRTLRCWRENFTAAERALAELGYDERFRRMWKLYLAYCEAGFAERRIGDVQIVLAKPRAVKSAWREMRGGWSAPAARKPARAESRTSLCAPY